MVLLLRLLVLGALSWLAFILFDEVGQASSGDQTDATRIVLLFGGIVVVALGLAALAALWILPQLGERLVGAIYNPDEEIERDPHASALARKASGDWQEAILEYRKCYDRNPEDSVALNEIVHLYTDKLADPDSAAQILEGELAKEWPPEQAAFLASRLVDVYWTHQHNAVRAREILIQVAETMPDTSHAANAQHRLREIDRSLEMQESPFGLPAPTEEGRGDAGMGEGEMDGEEDGETGRREDGGMQAESDQQTPG